MKYLYLSFVFFTLFLSIARAGTTIIKDPVADNYATVDSMGSLKVLQSGMWNIGLLGRGVYATFVQSYSSANLVTGAFTTIINSTTSSLNEIDIFDNSGGLWYLSYASTCGALTSTANAIIIGPGGGGKDFQIPTGKCVGFEALGANITTGNVYMTFYK